jgi:pimeloyl-ACP methyl ester carboxylesterase
MNGSDGAVLNYETVTAEGAEPKHWIFVTHGIYGAGRNWATVMRNVVRSRPEWGARLIDLREHGGSKGFEAPHTIENAAADLERLAESVGRPSAVLGHSFGGKVVLTWAGTRPDGLRQVWVIDAPLAPGEPKGSAWEMLDVLRALPGPFETREAAVDALMAKKIAEPTARWMATNLDPRDDALHWRFDLDAIEALILDFFATDVRDVVSSPPDGMEIHIVRALRASTISDAKADELRELAEQSPVFLHEVDGGHWLNADCPDEMHALLTESLRGDG